jgi:hypothetical protein
VADVGVDPVKYDAVLSHHLNPLTCGVAKFNTQLARRLGVPCSPLGTPSESPLVSIKFSELTPAATSRLLDEAFRRPVSLFLHDAPRTEPEWALVRGADGIYAANTAIADTIRPMCPDVIDAFCPSTLEGHAARSAITVLCFGMAHKFHAAPYVRLRGLLEAHGEPYTVSLSTGIHEGTPWDAGFQATIGLLREIFGDHLRVLGFLGDDALAAELHACAAVALFYEPAVRANNTTLWAALDAGALTITNLDADSPPELVHGVTVFDLDRLTGWPQPVDDFSRPAARRVAQRYGWERLLELLAA